MYLLNLRDGFATNSRSSHSLIYSPGITKLFEDSSDVKSGMYGQFDFTLASEESKKLYILGNILNGPPYLKWAKELCKKNLFL